MHFSIYRRSKSGQSRLTQRYFTRTTESFIYLETSYEGLRELGKTGKTVDATRVADAVDKLNDSGKVANAVDKATDTGKAVVKSADCAGDVAKTVGS